VESCLAPKPLDKDFRRVFGQLRDFGAIAQDGIDAEQSEAEFRHRLLGAQFALHPVGEAVSAGTSFQVDRTALSPTPTSEIEIGI